MCSMHDIIITTPTYNRVNTLPKLYDSLKKQHTKVQFTWLLIDDGSTDETKEFANKVKDEGALDFIYVYQENGGKARALNKAFSLVETDHSLFVVVDSDDYLLDSAINIIDAYRNRYKENKNIGALFFYYQTDNGDILKTDGKLLEKDLEMTRFEYNDTYKQNDGCNCYFGRAIRKYRYPTYQNEKYVGPTVIQMEMGGEYKIGFSTKVIGVASYLDNGLTKSGRKLRLKNPLGMIHYTRLLINSEANLATRIKNAITIWPYAFIAKKTYLQIVMEVNKVMLLTLTYVPGKILYYAWKKKYL